MRFLRRRSKRVRSQEHVRIVIIIFIVHVIIFVLLNFYALDFKVQCCRLLVRCKDRKFSQLNQKTVILLTENYTHVLLCDQRQNCCLTLTIYKVRYKRLSNWETCTKIKKKIADRLPENSRNSFVDLQSQKKKDRLFNEG